MLQWLVEMLETTDPYNCTWRGLSRFHGWLIADRVACGNVGFDGLIFLKDICMHIDNVCVLFHIYICMYNIYFIIFIFIYTYLTWEWFSIVCCFVDVLKLMSCSCSMGFYSTHLWYVHGQSWADLKWNRRPFMMVWLLCSNARDSHVERSFVYQWCLVGFIRQNSHGFRGVFVGRQCWCCFFSVAKSRGITNLQEPVSLSREGCWDQCQLPMRFLLSAFLHTAKAPWYLEGPPSLGWSVLIERKTSRRRVVKSPWYAIKE